MPSRWEARIVLATAAATVVVPIPLGPKMVRRRRGANYVVKAAIMPWQPEASERPSPSALRSAVAWTRAARHPPLYRAKYGRSADPFLRWLKALARPYPR